MDETGGTLVIDLQEVTGPAQAPSHGQAADGVGDAVLRFVAREGNDVRYQSPPFPGPHLAGGVDAREDVAPGMNRALHSLRRTIQRDGWVCCGRGRHPWALRFERSLDAGRWSPAARADRTAPD